jgi:hypothetical protein
MATRAFIDQSGVEWLIWHVRPGQHTGRDSHRSTLPDELAEGWLCLESPVGKRRFYPVPPDWESIPDDKFEVLLHASISVSPRAAHHQHEHEATAT